MKICYFDFIHNLGGAQRSTIELISNIKDLNVEIHIVDAHGECVAFMDEAIRNNLVVNIIYPAKGTTIGKKSKIKRLLLMFKYFPTYLKSSVGILKYVQKNRIDFVWSNTFKGLFALLLIKLFTKTKLGFFIRGEGAIKNLSYLKKFFVKYFVDEILLQSESIKQIAIQFGIQDHKISIISNVIDPKRISFIDEQHTVLPNSLGFKVVLPATVIPEKGILEAVEAIKIWKENINDDISLFVIGAYKFQNNTYNFHESLQVFIEKNDLKSNIHFLGFRKDVIQIMKESDVVLLPSYSEGMPRVIMEGMALGKSIIATNVGAIPDLITDKVNGLLIRPKHSEDVFKALKQLYDNPKLKNMLEFNSSIHIKEKYSLESQLHQFTTFLKRIR